MKYTFSQIKTEQATQAKELNNPVCGITVKSMPAKIGGIFQKGWERVTISVTDANIGRTCNGDQHREAVEKLRTFVAQFAPYQYEFSQN